MTVISTLDRLQYRLGIIWMLILFFAFTRAGRQVHTKSGMIRGTEVRYGDKIVDAFLGIPFAKPPVGELRFKHPQPIPPWKGVYNATKLPNTCIQESDLFFGDVFRGSNMWNPNTNLSEDCLYLNVWVPRTGNFPIQNSAVLIWIYGGGFYSGTSTLEVYDAKYLAAENDIIVVSMQYRVGMLGFLALGHPEAPGNAGLFDQLMALTWINDNIASFGGDPENMTIVGESAGSVSVSMHLLSPLSRSKFQRAIMQSGSANMAWATLSDKEAKRRGLAVARDYLDCNDPDIGETIKCLRAHPARRISESEWLSDGPLQFPFVPVVDGSFLTETPDMSLKSGNYKKCPLLIGSNKDEGSWFIIYTLKIVDTETREFIKKIDKNHFQNGMRELFKFYPQFPQEMNYFGQEAIIHSYTHWMDPDDHDQNIANMHHSLGDYHIVCPLNEWAKSYARGTNSVYYYHLTHRSSQNPWPKWMGVMHGDDINYIFGEPFNRNLPYTKKERQLSSKIMQYWTNFAKTGDPNQVPGLYSLDEWPLYTPTHMEYLELNTRLLRNAGNFRNTGRGPRIRHCAFWKEYLPNLVHSTGDIDKAMAEWKIQFQEWSSQYIVDWKHQYNNFLNTQKGKCSSSTKDDGK